MKHLMGRCTKCDVTIKVVLGTLTPEEARKKLEGIQMFECPGHHVELSGPLGYWEVDWATVHEDDAKQSAFDAMLARHPATLAENARRAETRHLEKERLEKIAERQSEREERRRCAGVRHLARRWHAKLAPAHAS